MLRPPLAAYGERLGDRRRLPFFVRINATKTKRRHGVTRRGGSLWPWRRGRRSCSRVIQYACATMRAGRCRQLVRVCRLANRALCRWPRCEAKEYGHDIAPARPRRKSDMIRVMVASALLVLLVIVATSVVTNAACTVAGWTSGQWTRPVFECEKASNPESSPRQRRARRGARR